VKTFFEVGDGGKEERREEVQLVVVGS